MKKLNCSFRSFLIVLPPCVLSVVLLYTILVIALMSRHEKQVSFPDYNKRVIISIKKENCSFRSILIVLSLVSCRWCCCIQFW